MSTTSRLTALGAAAVVLTIGAAPFLAHAADHLDAPSLGSLSAGSLQGDRDLNDLYVFEGSNAGKTVLAMTVSPAAGLLGPLAFGANVRYTVHVDNTGDNVADVDYVARFGAGGSGPGPKQSVTLSRNGVQVAAGATGNTIQVAGGGKLFAGLRSDPFFFDLLGFRGSLGLGPNSNTLCDSDPTDFFKTLNTLAIIVEVPDAALGRHIGVWATTEQWIGGEWVARDQMGRPAINTVFNHTAQDKEDFNVTPPSRQATAFGGKFVQNTKDTLLALSALDGEGAYADGEAAALASVLIPDVMTYDTSTHAVGPLNGRRLRDDVIDVELNITTGGDPLGLFPERDATGGVPSDCVGPHSDYQSTWPYLGIPH
ncbi:MAG TPA: DUF4331 family protein [Candidatus Limnocylindrales bacterium]|nr:DUF4331 family protein [Candidatus Limnocylindrales bacterium]